MRYGPGHKEEAKVKILGAAGRGFRRLGFGGVGVDGLAKEAGVTSGAFYGHFQSKAEAFEAVALAGLVELREGIETFRSKEGEGWLAKFVDFYMGTKRTCELGESCGMQTLTPEVARAGRETKSAYEAQLLQVVDAVAEGLLTGTLITGTVMQRRKTAWAILAMLSGGVTLARATNDPKVGSQIASAVKNAVLEIAALR
ncbi:MAG: TetR/AcrR family transcriptional regulator [Hyphomicrobium sp.]|jgi:AcrR family transcriptional regulator